MVTKEELLELRSRILPPGATQIIELLTHQHAKLEMTSIVLENVPLLIIGRHGMIARLLLGGKIVKLSDPKEILRSLTVFFEQETTLYLFINLPAIRFPEEVQQVIYEASERVKRKDHILHEIDQALEQGDRQRFDKLVRELKELDESTGSSC